MNPHLTACACSGRTEEDGVEQVDALQFEKLVLALFGRDAIRIPRCEADAAEALDKIYSRARDVEPRSPGREKATRELLAATEAFLETYPGSLLAEDAAYRQARSIMQLGRYEEAKEAFERFGRNIHSQFL